MNIRKKEILSFITELLLTKSILELIQEVNSKYNINLIHNSKIEEMNSLQLVDHIYKEVVLG